MNLVLQDEQLKQRLLEKGAERAKNFDWPFTAARILKELNQLH